MSDQIVASTANNDSGVAYLLRKPSLRAVVLPCVARLGSIDAHVPDLFEEVFDGVCDKGEDFTTLLTRWLLGEGIAFNAISSLLGKCYGRQLWKWSKFSSCDSAVAFEHQEANPGHIPVIGTGDPGTDVSLTYRDCALCTPLAGRAFKAGVRASF